jgi:predicted unusual protein kinase regulating ubiquinone biosynthesis (AarF/ABC1/UbiB family)
MNVDGENKIGIIDYGIMGTVTAHDQNIYYNFFMKLLIDKQPWDSAEILMLGLIYPKHRYLELSEERKLEVLTKTSTIISNIIKSNTTIELHHLYDINLMLYNYELGLTREFSRIQVAFSIATCLCKEVYGSNSMILDMSNAIETLISHDKLLDI